MKNRLGLASFLIAFVMIAESPSHSVSPIVRKYNIFKNFGEESYEFIEIVYDFSKKNGTFCWFDGLYNPVDNPTLEKLIGGADWSTFLNLEDKMYKCFSFIGYAPGNDFHSPGSIRFGEWYMNFFFYGTLEPNRIEGRLHQFSVQIDGKYPSHTTILVSTAGTPGSLRNLKANKN